MNDVPDPIEADARATDMSAKRVLFDQANELLDPKGVFMLAVRALRIRWYGEWLAAKDWETEARLKAKSAVLAAIPEELQRYVNDYKMGLDKQKQHARGR